MEFNLIFLALVIIVIILLRHALVTRNDRQKVFKNNVYKYFPKESLMTRAEEEFYWKLLCVAENRYFVHPQVHLSALLDHHVKGQDWRYAFRHINGKSVDYVLCDKTTLKPVYAVELDDYSHDSADRKERDSEVERIFSEANLPLVRFRNHKKLSDKEIIETFQKAQRLVESKK